MEEIAKQEKPKKEHEELMTKTAATPKKAPKKEEKHVHINDMILSGVCLDPFYHYLTKPK